MILLIRGGKVAVGIIKKTVNQALNQGKKAENEKYFFAYLLRYLSHTNNIDFVTKQYSFQEEIQAKSRNKLPSSSKEVPLEKDKPSDDKSLVSEKSKKEKNPIITKDSFYKFIKTLISKDRKCLLSLLTQEEDWIFFEELLNDIVIKVSKEKDLVGFLKDNFLAAGKKNIHSTLKNNIRTCINDNSEEQFYQFFFTYLLAYLQSLRIKLQFEPKLYTVEKINNAVVQKDAGKNSSNKPNFAAIKQNLERVFVGAKDNKDSESENTVPKGDASAFANARKLLEVQFNGKSEEGNNQASNSLLPSPLPQPTLPPVPSEGFFKLPAPPPPPSFFLLPPPPLKSLDGEALSEQELTEIEESKKKNILPPPPPPASGSIPSFTVHLDEQLSKKNLSRLIFHHRRMGSMRTKLI